MQKNLCAILFFCSIGADVLAPKTTQGQVFLNPGVDTSGSDVRSALKFYNNYLSDFKGKALPDLSKYWSAAALKSHKIPDQLIYAINDDPLYNQGYSRTVFYIKPSKAYIHLKTQFSYPDSNRNVMTLAITNHYVAFDQHKKPYFISPIALNTSLWQHKKVRNIEFIYPPYHRFNSVQADKLIDQVVTLEKEWGLTAIPIRYYFADTKEELDRMKGFDYAIGMGNLNKPSGISDSIDNQVFCGGLGENYFHEVVHVYLNRLYPKSPLKEGIAVLYGGSMGSALKWHLERVNKYLLQHPEVSLNDLEDFWYPDPYTNPGSAIEGMICKIVYQKDGIKGLKRLMSYTGLNDIFEKEFNTPQGEWNAFLRSNVSSFVR